MSFFFDPVRDIERFHKNFGLTYDGPPRQLPFELAKFRTIFMAEELIEYVTAQPGVLKQLIESALIGQLNVSDSHSLEKRYDALIDLVYVALGTAYLHGFDFKEGWKRVHAANMKKMRCISGTTRGGMFDVIKPPDWTPPSLADLVRR